MAKLVTSDVGSFTQAAVTTINTNFQATEEAMENTLSRDGTAPNQMEADLDMNENDVLNVNLVDATRVDAGQIYLNGTLIVPDTDFSDADALLTAIKTVDGPGSGLDADTVDGAQFIDDDTFATASPTNFNSAEATKAFAEDTENHLYTPRPVSAPAYVRNVGDWMRQERWIGDFGAVGGLDDQATFQAAANEVAAGSVGGPIKIPAGSYVIGSSINLDLSAFDTLPEINGYTFEGAGANCCELVSPSGTTHALLNITNDANLGEYGVLRGLKFRSAGTRQGTGILADNLAFMKFSDLLFFNLEYGFRATDILSSIFDNVKFRWNKYGSFFEGRVDASRPNALRFRDCVWGNNYEWGCQIVNGSVANFDGGSFEGNGKLGAESNRHGLKIQLPGFGGGNAVNLRGLYFENNANHSDLWLNQGNEPAPCSYLIEGCTFNRVTATDYTTNNIVFDQSVGGGDAKVVLIGNGFRGFSPYTESSSERYIARNASANALFTGGGNTFGSTTAAPAFQLAPLGAKARGRFNGTSASPISWTSNNGFTGTITKTSTGIYQGTYWDTSIANDQHIHVTLSAEGTVQIFTNGAGSFELRTRDGAGTLTDFASITVMVF